MPAPLFDSSGQLPPGIHELDWSELVDRFGRSARRQWLIQGLAAAIKALAAAGCRVVFVDGSFASSKESPNDYDACWEMAGVDLHQLMATEPVFFKFGNGRAEQKARFRGEFFPADMQEIGSGKTFVDFFQTDPDTGHAKGILKLTIKVATP